MQEVVIVTGLPRSGTSLLMSMLQAGGIPVHTDARRGPDRHNPKGYFEHSAVLELASDSSWLDQTGGRAVKILTRQMEFVPPQVPARVLLLERNLQEVADSQGRMLGETSPSQDWLELMAKELRRFKGWLARQPWPCLLVEHRRLLDAPLEMAAELQTFLNRPLDLEAMAAQVDASLYRSRSC